MSIDTWFWWLLVKDLEVVYLIFEGYSLSLSDIAFKTSKPSPSRLTSYDLLNIFADDSTFFCLKECRVMFAILTIWSRFCFVFKRFYFVLISYLFYSSAQICEANRVLDILSQILNESNQVVAWLRLTWVWDEGRVDTCFVCLKAATSWHPFKSGLKFNSISIPEE